MFIFPLLVLPSPPSFLPSPRIITHTHTHIYAQGGSSGWENDTDKPNKSSLASSSKVLERMDVFTKFHDEDKVQTSQGTTISLFSWLLIVVLLVSETYQAFFTNTTKGWCVCVYVYLYV